MHWWSSEHKTPAENRFFVTLKLKSILFLNICIAFSFAEISIFFQRSSIYQYTVPNAGILLLSPTVSSLLDWWQPYPICPWPPSSLHLCMVLNNNGVRHYVATSVAVRRLVVGLACCSVVDCLTAVGRQWKGLVHMLQSQYIWVLCCFLYCTVLAHGMLGHEVQIHAAVCHFIPQLLRHRSPVE